MYVFVIVSHFYKFCIRLSLTWLCFGLIVSLTIAKVQSILQVFPPQKFAPNILCFLVFNFTVKIPKKSTFCEEIQVFRVMLLFAEDRPFEVVEQSFQTTSLFITTLTGDIGGNIEQNKNTRCVLEMLS